jgi:hypothetical protein
MIRERKGENMEDVVCMTQGTMRLHVREQNNSSKMVLSNDQERGREGEDMEMQQWSSRQCKFP